MTVCILFMSILSYTSCGKSRSYLYKVIIIAALDRKFPSNGCVCLPPLSSYTGDGERRVCGLGRGVGGMNLEVTYNRGVCEACGCVS